MHREGQLSATHEMYLKVLYGLEKGRRVARVRDMAEGLGVRPGTVTAVLKKLEAGGLVVHEHYGEVTLTPAGKNVAECVVRRFETIRGVLLEFLSLDEETADLDACMMEHAVSPATINRMERVLQLVRAGKIDRLPTPSPRQRPRIGQCAECETAGACQAEALAELNRLARRT